MTNAKLCHRRHFHQCYFPPAVISVFLACGLDSTPRDPLEKSVIAQTENSREERAERRKDKAKFMTHTKKNQYHKGVGFFFNAE